MFPVFSEAFTGVKQTVGIPFFNAVNVPLFLLLVFLMGVGPMIAWKRSSIRNLAQTFLVPFLGALIVAGALVWAGIVEFWPVLSFAISFFVLMTILSELSRGLASQASTTKAAVYSPSNVAALFRRHRIKYGAHVIHLGVVVMTVAITASMAFKIEKEFTLAPQERINIGRFSLELQEFHEESTKNYQAVQAHVALRSQGSESIEHVLAPELRFYPKNKETTTEVALRMGGREDVYLVLAGLDETGAKASMKVFINPFQVWLWYGAIIMIFGSLIVIVPVARTSVVVPGIVHAEGVGQKV
jgi:cytochrome c-type biogenesis protein CcmF